MDNSTIGIKIADGTFYPIIEGESLKKKKLVLTTVNDDQGSVQIDLFRGNGTDIADAQYVGSLVIEDIMPGGKGEPEIELIVGVDEDGTLNAVAGDVGSGDKQSLSVSLESLAEDAFETPNFELDDTVFDEVPDFGDIPEFDGDESEDEDDFGDIPEFDEEPVADESMSLDDDDFGSLPSFEDEVPSIDEEPALDEDSVFDDVPALDEDSVFDDVPALDEDSVFDDVPALDEDSVFDDVPSLDEDSVFDDVPSLDEDSVFDDVPAPDESSMFDEEPLSEDSDFGDFPAFSGETEVEESFEEDGFPPSGIDTGFETEEDEEPPVYEKKKNPVAIAAIVIIILLLLAIGAFMLLRGRTQESVPPLVADNAVTADDSSAGTEPDPVPQPAAEKPEPAVEPEPELAPEPAPAVETVSSSEVPPAGRGGGVWYRLKWGDTLWNLSKSFYRTPWLYGLIAVENDIKNPDVIYAGTDLFIPEN